MPIIKLNGYRFRVGDTVKQSLLNRALGGKLKKRKRKHNKRKRRVVRRRRRYVRKAAPKIQDTGIPNPTTITAYSTPYTIPISDSAANAIAVNAIRQNELINYKPKEEPIRSKKVDDDIINMNEFDPELVQYLNEQFRKRKNMHVTFQGPIYSETKPTASKIPLYDKKHNIFVTPAASNSQNLYLPTHASTSKDEVDYSGPSTTSSSSSSPLYLPTQASSSKDEVDLSSGPITTSSSSSSPPGPSTTSSSSSSPSLSPPGPSSVLVEVNPVLELNRIAAAYSKDAKHRISTADRKILTKTANYYNVDNVAKYPRTIPDIIKDCVAKIKKAKPIHASGKQKMHKDGLSNFEIDKMMSKYGNRYLGTISHDEIASKILPKVQPHSEGCFVINTDPASKSGSHWQAVYFDAKKRMEIDFYDSFGEPADKQLLRGIKLIANKLDANSYLKFKENRIVQQSDRSSNCGFFCVQFCINMLNQRHFQDASGWNDVVKGEKDIEHFKKQMGYGPWKYVKSFAKKVADVGTEAVSRIKTAITGRTHAPPTVRALLTAHGNATITSIKVARSPIQAAISHVLNLVSAGQVEANKRKLGYSDLYHLYMIINLSDGYSFKIERNQTVMVSSPSIVSGSEVVSVPVNHKVTLNDFIEKGSAGNSGFWNYSGTSNNCQMFVRDMLSRNGMYNSSLNTFINQDVVALLEHSPLARKLVDVVSDLGTRLDVLIHGARRKKVYT